MRCVGLLLALAAAAAAGEVTGTPAPPPAIAFSAGFTSDMVLRHSPAKPVVYGVQLRVGAVELRVEGVDGESRAVNYTVQAAVAADGVWRAVLRPQVAGGSVTVTASGEDGSMAVLERVTFGMVWFCSGQSNMALSVWYTFSSERVTKEVLSGKYANLRIFQYGGMGTPYKAYAPQYATRVGATDWYNVSYAASLPEPHAAHVHLNPFHAFSATCMYYAMALTDQLGGGAPPIGLVQSAVGGTQIEAWVDNATLSLCRNESLEPVPDGPGTLYYGMVAPFVNMSVTGWVWYQGENNCFGVMGDSTSGYACELPALVGLWRRMWGEEAPFGVVTLAPGGAESSGNHMPTMRWAQTANHGVLPNPAMPKTFLAQAFDLGEPWNEAAGKMNCSHPDVHGKYGAQCKAWDPSSWNPEVRSLAPSIRENTAPVFLGPVHPRIKFPVGRRLAQAYLALFQGGEGAYTGPTIAGCEVGDQTLTLRFNVALLRGERVGVAGYDTNYTTAGDSMAVCTGAHPLANASTCACRSWNHVPCDPPGAWPCNIGEADHAPDAFYFCESGDGWKPPQPWGGGGGIRPNYYQAIWQPAPVSPGATPDTVVVDLGKVNTTGGVFAVKYAWPFGLDSCCPQPDVLEGLAVCPPANCPIRTATSLLPANPFLATISGGKCHCPAPQTCS